MSIGDLYKDALQLLIQLIRIPSFSGEEDRTANKIGQFLDERNIPFQRLGNNIIARNRHWSTHKKNIVLNSHHDTVKVVNGWTYDPHGANVNDEKLYGLGSNDAGASLVSLIACFVHFYEENIPFNLTLIASAEEENFGENGVASVLAILDYPIDVAIIGEPTQMHLAIAEKGLMVIDGVTTGRAGHAARDLGINALYLAVEDIMAIRQHTFERISPVLGEVRMTVTQIESGYQHNVIPDRCHYVVDVRNTEQYTNEEVLDQLKQKCHATLTPRSMKWQPSSIDIQHPLVISGLALGRSSFGSPTLSDQVHFTCPTLKMGPGVSERSHTPDEYIVLDEIRQGIELYIKLLQGLSK